jgi:hypothetical protein
LDIFGQLAEELTDTDICKGCVMVTVEKVEHPRLSVTLIEYVPAVRFPADDVVTFPGDQRYE